MPKTNILELANEDTQAQFSTLLLRSKHLRNTWRLQHCTTLSFTAFGRYWFEALNWLRLCLLSAFSTKVISLCRANHWEDIVFLDDIVCYLFFCLSRRVVLFYVSIVAMHSF